MLQESTPLPVAYMIPCVRFVWVVRLFVYPSQSRNTRYGWLATPYPTETFTLQEAPNLLRARNLLFPQSSIAGWHLWVNTRVVTSCCMGYHPARNRPKGIRVRNFISVSSPVENSAFFSASGLYGPVILAAITGPSNQQAVAASRCNRT